MLDADRDDIRSIYRAANRACQPDDNSTASEDGGPGLSDATGHVLHTL